MENVKRYKEREMVIRQVIDMGRKKKILSLNPL